MLVEALLLARPEAARQGRLEVEQGKEEQQGETRAGNSPFPATNRLSLARAHGPLCLGQPGSLCTQLPASKHDKDAPLGSGGKMTMVITQLPPP